MTPPTHTRSRWGQTGWFGLLLVAAVVFAYQPAWNAGFIWDDDDYVTHNPLLSAPDGLKRIWFSTDSPSQYFPLVYTTFRLEHSLWGLNASGYHWVNLLLHAVNALLVWRLLKRLAVLGAWLGAAIFALHPVQVESVAWISELKNVQSLTFFLLSLLAWLEFVEERRGWGAYALAWVFCALALFSKTTACTLPAALILILWLKGKPITWARAVQVVPFVLAGLAMGLVSIWWERNHQGTHGEIYGMSLLDRLLVATRALWFYAGKFLWPTDLVFNYPLWKIDPAHPFAYAWLAACLGACAAIYLARRFVGRSVEVAVVFYVAMLSPLLGFVMLYTFKYTFVADHYQYVALIGPAALVAAGVTRGLGRWENHRAWLQPVLGGVLVATLGVLTWRQSRMYHDLEILWRTTIERNPDSYMGHNNLGAILLARGEVDEAIARFRRALEILPDHGNAHGNLAHALLQKGQIDDALVHLEKAVESEPNVAKPHSDLSFGLLQKGRVDEAIAQGRRALELQPAFLEAHNNLGWALLHKGEAEEALDQFQKALALQPNSADIHYNLGTAFVSQGQFNQAIAHYEKALELQPGFAKAHNNLGSVFFQNGQMDAAVAQFQAALKSEPDNRETRENLVRSLLQAKRGEEALVHLEAMVNASPDSADTRHQLALCLYQLGRVDEAIASFEKVVELKPSHGEAQNNLGWALLQLGQLDEAIARFEAVLRLQPDFALAHHNLALALLDKNQVRDAISHYRAFLQLAPNHAPVLAGLAWVLATWPDATVRQGVEALELAERANLLSGNEQPMILRTLAAAYAENGRFAEAISTVKQAIRRLEGPSDSPLAEALREQLKTYQAGRPFRQSVTTVAAAETKPE